MTSTAGKTIKVVFIITDLDVGGAEEMLFKLLTKMDRTSFDPSVISLRTPGHYGPRITEMGIPVMSLGAEGPLALPGALAKLRHHLKRLEPDVIQGWMYHGNLAAALAIPKPPAEPGKKAGRVALLWNIRGTHVVLSEEKRMTAWVIKAGAWLSARPTKIVNNSKVSAALHEERLGYAKKSVIIPNGFDTDLFVPSEEARRAVRNELDVEANAVLVGMFGRYHPVKDHATFLAAAGRLRRANPSVCFVMAGRGVDSHNGDLMEMIQKNGLEGAVELLGERSDMPALVAAMDAVALTSRSEGFPNVVGEAMSCAVPCVATDVGDCDWIIGETGLVTPPGDPDSISAALQRLIEMPQTERRKLGLRARDRIIENFSLDAVVASYEQLFREVAT